jgi:hypothetical protein
VNVVIIKQAYVILCWRDKPQHYEIPDAILGPLTHPPGAAPGQLADLSAQAVEDHHRGSRVDKVECRCINMSAGIVLASLVVAFIVLGWAERTEGEGPTWFRWLRGFLTLVSGLWLMTWLGFTTADGGAFGF